MKTIISAIALVGLMHFPIPSAYAADLGGSCCEDLEARVAELEASTVRKGNKKIVLTLSGTISYGALWSSQNFEPGSGATFDVTGNNVDIVQNPMSATVIRLDGSGKISPDVKIGFALELLPTLNDGAGTVAARDAYVYVSSAMAGKISLGFQEAAGDGAGTHQIVDLGDVAGLFDFSLLNHVLSFSDGTSFSAALTLPGGAFGRADSIRYDLADIGKSGLSLSASYAPEGKVMDGAVNWVGKIGTVGLVVGAAYEDQNSGALKVYAVSGGIREEKSGLFAQGGYEKQIGTNANGSLTFSTIPSTISIAIPISVTDLAMWHVQGGISQNFTKLGDTAVYGELGRITAASLSGQPNFWGAGVRQNLDGAAADVFAGYRLYTLDDSAGDTVSTVIAGATVHF